MARFLGIITRKPAHVEMDEPEATAFELVERIEVVMHHVMMNGLGAFSTQDLGKMNSALVKVIDNMDAVIRTTVVEQHKTVAMSVKEKAEGLNLVVFITALAQSAVQTE